MQLCSKSFDWCSSKVLGCFWPDKKHIVDFSFAENNNSFVILLPLCSKSVGWHSPNSFFTWQNEIFGQLFSQKDYRFIFSIQFCSKSFHWCSPKGLNNFWPDKKQTLHFFPDKTYSFISLLRLCSQIFGWRSPKCRFLDKRSVLYKFFERNITTL